MVHRDDRQAISRIPLVDYCEVALGISYNRFHFCLMSGLVGSCFESRAIIATPEVMSVS